MKTKYKLIPLLESGLNPNEVPTNDEKTILKNFYMILKCKEDHSFFVRHTNGAYLMFNKKLKQIGVQAFNIQSKLNLESTSEEIQKEVKRFDSTWYKKISMNTYLHLKEFME